MRKHVLKTLGVSLLAALGLMAFVMASAQAEIKISGSAALATGKSVTGAQEGLPKLLVPALGIYVDCKKFTVLAGSTIISGTALATILFEECEEYAETTNALLPCEIEDGGLGGKKGHLTAKANIKTILHKERTYLLAEPDGQAFFTKFRNGGAECNLPRNVEIKGPEGKTASTVFKVVTGDTTAGPEVLEPLIESSAAICELFPADVLTYGTNPACIDGAAKLKISTLSHEGLVWGAN
jgi:hypothetical protein